MKLSVFFGLTLILFSCRDKSEKCLDCDSCGINLNIKETTLEEVLHKKSNFEKPLTDSTELKESIAKIEVKYGEQWDFCKCVVVNDSIDKAIKRGDTDEKLLDRWDIVDKKCQAFRIQNPSTTPEQREAHERRVKKCLKEAEK
jgi:hypothetical protein